MMDRSDMIQKWLSKALHKIDTMPREELIESLERAGLVELVEDEENIDETN